MCVYLVGLFQVLNVCYSRCCYCYYCRHFVVGMRNNIYSSQCIVVHVFSPQSTLICIATTYSAYIKNVTYPPQRTQRTQRAAERSSERVYIYVYCYRHADIFACK